MTAALAIFAALPWECRPVLRHLRDARRQDLDGFPAWRGRTGSGEALVVQTGIGVARAAAAARAVDGAGGAAFCLATGCAGALACELGPGDLAIATTIVRAEDATALPTDPAATEQVRSVAARLPVRSALGPVLCSPRVLASAAEKRAASERTGAIAVEMEGAALGTWARAAGVPFASVRAILDDAGTDLDDTSGFVDPATGRVRPLDLARHLVQTRHALHGLARLRRLARQAARSLDRFFAAYLEAA